MNLLGPRHQLIVRWLWIALAVIAFAGSMLPQPAKVLLHTIGVLHFWMHLVLFMVLGALAVLSSGKTKTRILLALCVVLLGVAIEYAETIRTRWPVESIDVVTDTGGALFGSLCCWILLRKPRSS